MQVFHVCLLNELGKDHSTGTEQPRGVWWSGARTHPFPRPLLLTAFTPGHTWPASDSLPKDHFSGVEHVLADVFLGISWLSKAWDGGQKGGVKEGRDEQNSCPLRRRCQPTPSLGIINRGKYLIYHLAAFSMKALMSGGQRKPES